VRSLSSSRRDRSCCARAGDDHSYERGSAVIEAAVAIPALIAITLALLWTISLGVTHVRVDEAAYSAARLAARGASEDSVRLAVQSRLASAEIEMTGDADTVSVTVTDHVLADVPILRGLATPVSATAVVAREIE
jgi:hypothetical protein